MNPLILAQILQFGMQMFLQVPALIEAGRDVGGILKATGEKIVVMIQEKRPPNEQEWAEMNDMIAALRAELHG